MFQKATTKKIPNTTNWDLGLPYEALLGSAFMFCSIKNYSLVSSFLSAD